MREVVLDTETTGLDPLAGHRVVEIGCVELLNHMPTGRTYQTYIDPERDMPPEAGAVSGLTTEFLKGKPLFMDVVDAFLAFVGDAALVAHNAGFDLGFINAELVRLKRPAFSMDRAIDTVAMARRRYPGAPASLDALCKRFGVDTTARFKHGALIDAELLAKVYLELIGGREPGLALSGLEASGGSSAGAGKAIERPYRAPRAHAPSAEEIAAHAAFVGKLNDPVWAKIAAAK